MKFFCLIVLSAVFFAVQARSYFRRGDDDTDHCKNFQSFSSIEYIFTNYDSIKDATQDEFDNWENNLENELQCVHQIVTKDDEDWEDKEKELHGILMDLMQKLPHVDTTKGDTRFLGECQKDYMDTDFGMMQLYEADAKARGKIWECFDKIGEDAIDYLQKFVDNSNIDDLKTLVTDVREMNTLLTFYQAVETSIWMCTNIYYCSNKDRLQTSVYPILDEILKKQRDAQDNGGVKKQLPKTSSVSNKRASFLRRDNEVIRRIAELLKKEHFSLK